MGLTANRSSRRTVLKGAVVGAGTAALASCGGERRDEGAGVRSSRVKKVSLDPAHSSWSDTPYSVVPLGPQNIALPQRITPSVKTLQVRSVHDGKRIGFRLDWNDHRSDAITVRVDDFRDACAVLLAPGNADQALRMMGSQAVPATLLHWKSDWERMVAKGDEGLDVAFPNRSVDTYPIVWKTPPAEVGIQSYIDADATEWLPAIDVGNPVAGRAERKTSVEKAIAYGFSTTTSAPTQDAVGRAVRTDDGWRVVIVKPLGAVDEGEMALEPGTVSSAAFAVWAGNRRDVGSRKCPSVQVLALDLEA